MPANEKPSKQRPEAAVRLMGLQGEHSGGGAQTLKLDLVV